MKVRKLLSVALVLLCGVMFFGCSGSAKPKIELDTQYFLEDLGLDAFAFKMVKKDDHSHLKFDSDFKTMTIWFDTLETEIPGGITITFVVTSCERKSGQIKGTASRLQTISEPDTGKLVRYSFWSDDVKIYLQTLVSYPVYTIKNGEHTAVTIQQNSIVARFWRNTPGRIPSIGGDL